MKTLTHYDKTWPHPHQKLDDPVDPRLVRVISRALRTAPDAGRDVGPVAEHVAQRVWDWLAEGDR